MVKSKTIAKSILQQQLEALDGTDYEKVSSDSSKSQELLGEKESNYSGCGEYDSQDSFICETPPPRKSDGRRLSSLYDRPAKRVLLTQPEVKDPGQGTHKSWMYTINNYTEKTEKILQALECNYHVYGREVGETGTKHLQGCITFQKGMRKPQARKLFSNALQGHLIVPKCIEAARNYCLKDGDVFVKDNRKQGSRTDITEMCNYIKAGNTLRDTIVNHPETYVKFHGGIDKIFKYYHQDINPRRSKPVVSWYYGATGSGKSYSVFSTEAKLWSSSAELTYFLGYENEPAVLFDDFRAGCCKLSFLLRLLDRYPFRVNVKYGDRQWNPERIYITCNTSPSTCYNLDPENIKQLLRRIDNIVEFTNSGEEGTYRESDISHIVEKGIYELPEREGAIDLE